MNILKQFVLIFCVIGIADPVECMIQADPARKAETLYSESDSSKRISDGFVGGLVGLFIVIPLSLIPGAGPILGPAALAGAAGGAVLGVRDEISGFTRGAEVWYGGLVSVAGGGLAVAAGAPIVAGMAITGAGLTATYLLLYKTENQQILIDKVRDGSQYVLDMVMSMYLNSTPEQLGGEIGILGQTPPDLVSALANAPLFDPSV